jgi:Ca2+-binding RTX toxin-like protein
MARYDGTSGNDNLPGSNENDYLYGLAGDDVLDGGAGYDTLDGGVGNDTLNGGADHFGQQDKLNGGEGDDILSALGWHGGDILEGGAGNDTYVIDVVENGFDPAAPTLIEVANAGIDTVQVSATWTLGEHFENLTLTGDATIDGMGNALDNILAGNSANNSLVGGEGKDTLIGGAGSDQLNGYGTTITDNSRYDNLTGGEGADYFVLGGNWGVSYVERGDGYAVIQDWDASADSIQAYGSASQYSLQFKNVLGTSAKDTEIYYIGGGEKERIGVVQDTTDINIAHDFTFVV